MPVTGWGKDVITIGGNLQDAGLQLDESAVLSINGIAAAIDGNAHHTQLAVDIAVVFQHIALGRRVFLNSIAVCLQHTRVIYRVNGDGQRAAATGVGGVGNNRNGAVPVVCWRENVIAVGTDLKHTGLEFDECAFLSIHRESTVVDRDANNTEYVVSIAVVLQQIAGSHAVFINEVAISNQHGRLIECLGGIQGTGRGGNGFNAGIASSTRRQAGTGNVFADTAQDGVGTATILTTTCSQAGCGRFQVLQRILTILQRRQDLLRFAWQGSQCGIGDIGCCRTEYVIGNSQVTGFGNFNDVAIVCPQLDDTISRYDQALAHRYGVAHLQYALRTIYRNCDDLAANCNDLALIVGCTHLNTPLTFCMMQSIYWNAKT